MVTSKDSLSRMMARLTAEAGQYNPEKGLAADHFTGTYTRYIEGDVKPPAYVFAFDAPEAAEGFHKSVDQSLSIGTQAELQASELCLHGTKDYMVLVIGSVGQGSDLVATRLQNLADTFGGRLVLTMGKPDLLGADDIRSLWDNGPTRR